MSCTALFNDSPLTLECIIRQIPLKSVPEVLQIKQTNKQTIICGTSFPRILIPLVKVDHLNIYIILFNYIFLVLLIYSYDQFHRVLCKVLLLTVFTCPC